MKDHESTDPVYPPGYPTWRYHRDKDALIVYSPEEEAALGHGWEKTPAAFGRHTANPEPGSAEVKSDKAPMEAVIAALPTKRQYRKRGEAQA